MPKKLVKKKKITPYLGIKFRRQLILKPIKARKDVEPLNEKHLERIAKDPEFIALNEDLKIRDERRERKFLSLNFQERKAENDKDDARTF